MERTPAGRPRLAGRTRTPPHACRRRGPPTPGPAARPPGRDLPHARRRRTRRGLPAPPEPAARARAGHAVRRDPFWAGRRRSSAVWRAPHSLS